MILQVAKLALSAELQGWIANIRLTRDGKLDSWERAARFQFMDGMIKDDENEWVSCTKI